MWKRCSAIFLALFFVIGISFALDTATAIDNPSFEDVYNRDIDGTGYFFPSDWIIGTATSSNLTEKQLFFIENNLLDGFVTIDTPYGTYAYANAFNTANWNSSYIPNNTISISNYQAFHRPKDSHFIVSGSYAIPTFYNGSDSLIGNARISFSGLTPEIDGAFNIIFNTSNYNTWENFSVEYDNGNCQVLSGNVNCTTPYYADLYTANIYSYFDYFDAQNISNYSVALYIDNLEIDDVIELEGTGDYYDTYRQSIENIVTSYGGCGIRPFTSNFELYSGKIMDSMKTKFLNITFSELLFRCNAGSGYSYTTYIKQIEYFDEIEDVWKNMTNGQYPKFLTWNPFCNGEIGSCLSGGNYGQYPLRRWTTEVTDIPHYFGLIVPKNANKINISFITYRDYLGETYPASLNFTISDVVQNSTTEINTNLADSTLPTFFPVLTQFVEQEGKNLTSYHLQLPFWYNESYGMKNTWVNASTVIDTWTTDTIIAGEYDIHAYDSSGWAIDTNDHLEYNNTASYSYFGESFHPSSTYLFNTEGEGICPSYCQLGSYFDGEYENDTCFYTEYSCDDRCLPDQMELNIVEINPTSAWFNFTSMDTNYWKVEDDNSTIVDSGSTTVNYVEVEGLDPDNDYTFYINGTEKYSCELFLSNQTDFTTPATSPIPDSPYSEAITNGTQAINVWINTGVTAFATMLGTNEVIAKSMIWLIITLLVSVAITKSLGQVVPNIDPFAVLGVSALIMIAIGFLFGWLGVLWVVLLGLGIGIFLFREFNKTVM